MEANAAAVPGIQQEYNRDAGEKIIFYIDNPTDVGSLLTEPFWAFNSGILADKNRASICIPSEYQNDNSGSVNRAALRILSRYFRIEFARRYDRRLDLRLTSIQNKNARILGEPGSCRRQVMERISRHNFKPEFFSLTPEETSAGMEIQKQLGIPPDASFVCIHHTDSDDASGSAIDPVNRTPWESLLPAVDYLLELGCHVVRTGEAGAVPLPSRNGIIDLPFVRNLDSLAPIWFWTKCRFMICDTASVHSMPLVFNGPPRLLINWTGSPPMSINPDDLFIPNHIRASMQGGRLVNFSERMFFGDDLKSDEDYHRAGLKVEPDSSEDILDAVMEMLRKLNKKSSPADMSDLRNRYESIAEKWHELKSIAGGFEASFQHGTRLAGSFLNKYHNEML